MYSWYSDKFSKIKDPRYNRYKLYCEHAPALRRLHGCVVMGINRTRRLFGRQKKDAWAASQCTLNGFWPRRYHFLSSLFLFFVRGRGKLHFRLAHRYFLKIWARWNNLRNISALDFDWMIGASKWQWVLHHCSILSLLLKKSYACLAETSWTKALLTL